MTASEARALTEARRAETAIDHYLRADVYPAIRQAAEWGHPCTSFIVDTIVGARWHPRDGEDQSHAILSRLEAEGYTVHRDGGVVTVSW